jgi:hypothetical protein
VQQDLPDRDERASHRGDHAHTVASGEVGCLHLAGAGLHDYVSWSQRAQHHRHALKHTKRTGELALAELHHESADEDGADCQDVEVCDQEPETVAHLSLRVVRN